MLKIFDIKLIGCYTVEIGSFGSWGINLPYEWQIQNFK